MIQGPAHLANANSAATQQTPTGFGLQPSELYKLVVESIDDYAIFALDQNGHILSWNAGAQRIKGYTAEEIIGKHFSVFYPQERIDEGFPDYELREAARVGRFEDEGWRVRSDGSRFWANVVITALRDPAGKLVGYAKVTRDLSERKEAEEALRASEERFRLLVEGVRDYAIFMLDPTGHITTWNEGARRIKGYTAEEITGKHFSIFYPHEDIASGKPERELRIAEATGVYEEEGWRLRKDRSQFWASVVITAVWRPNGELAGFSKVTRDLTERRAAQERALQAAQRAAAEEAARNVAEQARAAADEANRAKSRFLAAMSHELRTPLNAIGGYAELIGMGVRGPVSDEQRADLDRIKRSQQHLLGIINDILNFSRIEAGQTVYECSTIAMRDVMDSVAQMIQPQASAKGLDFKVIECPPDIVAWADRPKVEQILLNLVSNAVKFTDQGTVTLECSWKNPKQVEVAVCDTGAGIPEAELDRIFEPFVQVGRTLSRTHEGTGLGLAISRDLARGMSGDTTVRSKSREGSVFTLTLPRSKA